MGETIVLFGIAFIATFVILLARAEMTAGVRRKQMKQDMAKGIYRLDAILHVSGLSAPEKCKCGVVLTPEKLMITCAGKEYTLPLKRITYVDKKNETEMNYYMKSSFMKGVAGAAMFGMAGAVIGAAPKTKIRREEKVYALISYENTRGEIDSIVLMNEPPNIVQCELLVLRLQERIDQRVRKVDL